MAERWNEFYNGQAKNAEVSIKTMNGVRVALTGEFKVYHRKKQSEGLLIYIPCGKVARGIYERL